MGAVRSGQSPGTLWDFEGRDETLPEGGTEEPSGKQALSDNSSDLAAERGDNDEKEDVAPQLKETADEGVPPHRWIRGGGHGGFRGTAGSSNDRGVRRVLGGAPGGRRPAETRGGSLAGSPRGRRAPVRGSAEEEALPDLLVAAAHLYEEVQKRKVAGTPPGAVQGGKPAARAGA